MQGPAPIASRFPRPSVMGVVNVTPDSFSDGGVNFRAEDAVASARRMVEEGAAIVDVGGESTRPGSEGVSAEEELRRVEPVLEALQGEVPVSIDTTKAAVAKRAIALGAELVNDVTALRGDPELAGVVASSGAYLCLMHMQGEPRTMQDDPNYEDVASEVASFLEERLRFAVAAGIPEERICLDPGFGFGKSVEQNFELLARLGEIAEARPAGPRRALPQALARADPRRPRRDDRTALSQPGRGRRGLRARRRDLPRPRRPRARGGAHRGGGGRMITVELHGLEVFGKHGVLDHERRDGQMFFYDISIEIAEAPPSDRVEDTIDYRDIADCVQKVSDGHAFQLLEALASAVADSVVERFEVERVRVRVRKPSPAGIPAEYAAATVERSSS